MNQKGNEQLREEKRKALPSITLAAASRRTVREPFFGACIFVWFLFSSLHRAHCCAHVKLNSRVANTQPGHQMLMVAPMNMKI
jgi:hypothetical protein